MAVEIDKVLVAGEWMKDGKRDVTGEVGACWVPMYLRASD